MKKTKVHKISFLMAAHNEEKIIFKSLENLYNLPYSNYEVIIGLDGCTDNTEKIVKFFEKKSKKFKHYNLNLRQGKPAVINSIIKKAKGDIVIINDADWIFNVKSRENLMKFLSVFNNPRVGGIAESFAVEWQRENLRKANLGYKMVAYSSNLWFDYQKNNFALNKQGLLFIKEPTMFLTNIFRKSLFKENVSLGDDFERTRDIFDSGHDIVLFDDEDMPRMTATYTKIFVSDIFKQKIRTARAREQLQENRRMPVKSSYYLSSVFSIFANSWRYGIGAGILVSFWICLGAIATLISAVKSKFKKTSTKEGWTMRAKR